MAGFPNFNGSWPWPWPWIGSYCIPSCITHRPLPTCNISFKSKKTFCGRTDGRTDGYLRPALLGQLCRRVGLTPSSSGKLLRLIENEVTQKSHKPIPPGDFVHPLLIVKSKKNSKKRALIQERHVPRRQCFCALWPWPLTFWPPR